MNSIVSNDIVEWFYIVLTDLKMGKYFRLKPLPAEHYFFTITFPFV